MPVQFSASNQLRIESQRPLIDNAYLIAPASKRMLTPAIASKIIIINYSRRLKELYSHVAIGITSTVKGELVL